MRQRTVRKLLGVLLALALVLGLVPSMSLTAKATTPQSVSYIEYTWDESKNELNSETKTKQDTEYTMVESTTSTWGVGLKQTSWYVVSDSAIGGELTFGSRITVKGDVNLILMDGAKLTAEKGIMVSYGSSLTVYGGEKGNGQLIAGVKDKIDKDLPGIGGNESYGLPGTVIVHGGSVSATGGDSAAGIGGAHTVNDAGDGRDVIIYGGIVNATGGKFGAGIGGCNGVKKNTTFTGNSGNGGTVTIYGGIVNATGSYCAAGIGGGYFKKGGTVVVHGGTVTATTNADGTSVAIGRGFQGGDNGTVTIGTGLVVKAGANEAEAVDVTSTFQDAHDQKWVQITMVSHTHV